MLKLARRIIALVVLAATVSLSTGVEATVVGAVSATVCGTWLVVTFHSYPGDPFTLSAYAILSDGAENPYQVVSPGGDQTEGNRYCIYDAAIGSLDEPITTVDPPGYHIYEKISSWSSIEPEGSSPSAPSAEFDALPRSGGAPLVVSMHIVSTDNISSCAWYYGDGNTSTSCAPYHEHTYTTSGVYTVTLAVSGSGGSDSMTRKGYITVLNASPAGQTCGALHRLTRTSGGEITVFVPDNSNEVWLPDVLGNFQTSYRYCLINVTTEPFGPLNTVLGYTVTRRIVSMTSFYRVGPVPPLEETPTGKISGRVTDGHNHPLVDVSVGLLSATTDVLYQKTDTDANGNYSFNEVDPATTYKIWITLRDHNGKSSVRWGKYGLQVAARTQAFDIDPTQETIMNVDFGNSNLEAEPIPVELLDDLAIIYHHTTEVSDFVTTKLGFSSFKPVASIWAFRPAINTAYYDPLDQSISIGEQESELVPLSHGRPMNREWHEGFHHLMNLAIKWPPDAGYEHNHKGFSNENSSDSWAEGWAEFWSCVLWDSLGHPQPHIYRWGKNGSSFEENYEVWDGNTYLDLSGIPQIRFRSLEEFAVASLLWDLYDSKESSDNDSVDLSLNELWKVIGQATPENDLRDMRDVYEAFQNAELLNEDGSSVMVTDIDQIFRSHGFYADTGNRRWEAEEEIGWAGKKPRRNIPEIPNAYLKISVKDENGNSVQSSTLMVEMQYENSYYDYSYTVDLIDGTEEMVFFVPPPTRTLATATLTVIHNGAQAAPVAINNLAYWDKVVNANTDFAEELTFVLGEQVVEPSTMYIPSIASNFGPNVQPPTSTDVPIVDLEATNDGPTALGNPTQFTAAIEAGTNVIYEWDFGDGTTGTGANASHTYETVAQYTVQLTASNSQGSVSASTLAEVVDVPISGLRATNDGPVQVGVAVQFTAAIEAGTNVIYEWDFGDGETGSGASRIHIYTSIGHYTATVIATNGSDSQTATRQIEVLDTLITGLNVNNNGPTVIGDVTNFNASASGTNIVYSWDFGDGATSSGTNPDHIYTSIGDYTATVIATNGSDSQTATTEVEVMDTLITGFNASNDGPTTLGDPTSFTASTTGSNVVFTWDFGDGETGSGANPDHIYAAIGDYPATVTATNSQDSETSTTIVTVVDVAVSGLQASNNGPVEVGEPMHLTATIEAGTNVIYEWDFGDVTTGTGANVSHVYEAVNQYIAQVTASNSQGSATASILAEVVDVPISGLQSTNGGPVLVGELVQFTATVEAGTNVVYEWDFGDGTTGIGAGVSHSYTIPGPYTAGVIASNSNGNATATTLVEVTELPNDYWSNATMILGLPYATTQDVTYATVDADDPVFSCLGSQPAQTVWYRFEGFGSGMVTISTADSNYDTIVGVWNQDRTSIGCDDDSGENLTSRLSIPVMENELYIIGIGSYSGGGTNLHLNVDLSEGASAQFWNDTDLISEPVLTRYSSLAYRPSSAVSLPDLPNDGYSDRWTRYAYLERQESSSSNFEVIANDLAK